MNPFLFFIHILIYEEVVIVAYSNPPGIRPMFLPYFISRLILLLSTPWNPHSFKAKPKRGRFKANLLESPTKLLKGPVSEEFKQNIRPYEFTLWGCTPKIDF